MYTICLIALVYVDLRQFTKYLLDIIKPRDALTTYHNYYYYYYNHFTTLRPGLSR